MSAHLFPPSAPTPPTRPKMPRTANLQRSHSRAILPLALIFGVVTAALFITLIALLAPPAMSNPTTVTLMIDGETRQIETRADTVARLLDELRFDANSGDRIIPPPAASLQAGAIIRIDRARNVSLVVDGETRLLWTPLTNPADILRSEGVRVTAGDRVMIDGTSADPTVLSQWNVPVTQLSVRHIVPIHITDEDEGGTRTIMTTRETVGEALFDAGVTIYLSDSLSVPLNTRITAELAITIRRASPVTIIVDGDTLSTRGWGATVADALSNAGVTLIGLDYAIPDGDTRVLPGMSIRVIRVQETLVNEETTQTFETVYQADAELEIDQERVIQTGQVGVIRTTTRVRYENEVEISRTLEATETVTPQRDHIIGYGTNIVIRTLQTPDGVIEYWRVIRMYATSYHPAALGGDNITATGRTLVKGIVGSDPRILPYNTRIYVAGYGIGDIQDTGGPRRIRLWVDLGYSDADFEGWSRNTDVYILTPVPPADRILYRLPCCALVR